MPRDATLLLGPFLESGDAQVRRNAVIALAAVETPESVERLVDLACGDPGPAGEQALAELVKLPPERRETIRAALDERLADRARQVPAYDLAGKLRARGVMLGGPTPPLPARLRLAWRARHALYSQTRLKAGSIGAASGVGLAALVALVTLLLAFMAALGLSLNSMQPVIKGLVLVAPLLCLGFALLGTRLAAPFGAYPDRTAGALVEGAVALLWGVAAFVAVVLAVVLEGVFTGDLAGATAGGARAWTLFFVTVVALTVAVRAGCVAGAGLVRREFYDRAVRVAAGACAGIAVSILLLSLGIPRPAAWTDSAPVGMRGWLLLIPASFTLAVVLARIDSTVPIPGFARRPVRAAVAGAAIAFVLWFFAWPPLVASRPQMEPKLGWIAYAVPDSQEIQVGKLSLLKVAPVDSTNRTRLDLVVAVKSVEQDSIIEEADDPPEVSMVVDSGRYQLKLHVYTGVDEETTIKLGRTTGTGDLLPLLAGHVPGLALRWDAVRDQVLGEVRGGIEVKYSTGSADSAWREVLAFSRRELTAGRIAEGVAHFEYAQQVPGAEVTARDWNTVCSWGALWSQAPQVLPMCDRAVAMEPRNPSFRDNRGIARALAGDRAGAIEDFKAIAERQGTTVGARQREEWVRELEAGRMPFSPEVLRELRRLSRPRTFNSAF